MATIRKMWACKNSQCKNEKGKHRGYKKVCTGEKKALCKHCGLPMVLNENHTTRIQVNGEVRSKTLTADRRFAEDYLAECKTAARVGDLLPGEEKPVTWAAAKERFDAWLDDPGANDELAAKTVRFYRTQLQALEIPFSDRALGKVDFTRMNLQDIQKKHVDAFKSWRMKDRAASTVNGSIATLKRMYSVICSQERATLTPRLHEAMTDVFKVKLLECDNQVDTILETEEEIQVLLSQCKTPHLYHFVFGILNTGLRHDDMLGLLVKEINFNRNEIVTCVKGGTKVEIPLTGAYRAYLEDWLKNQKVRSFQGYVIPSTKGTTGRYQVESNIGFDTACENAAKHYEKLALEAASKKERSHLRATAENFRQLTPHCLRHTFATHFLYKASKSLGATAAVHVLSKILGHSSTYITERYSHALKDVQQASMAEFGAQMFSAAESR